jgi:hypothetical protein
MSRVLQLIAAFTPEEYSMQVGQPPDEIEDAVTEDDEADEDYDGGD